MRIIFLGDISVAQPFQIQAEQVAALRQADLVLANLEGPIVSNQEIRAYQQRGYWAVHNSPDVFDILDTCNVSAVYLANNHFYDVPLPASHTRAQLAARGIESVGAGANLTEATQPLVFHNDQTTAKVFAFGWDVIGCQPATSAKEGVSPFSPQHMLNTIRRLRATDSTSFVVFVMHWNYELELYPQPAHRQLAYQLIHEGVDTIIGLHSHVAQGVEMVNDKPIVYGLGNWFFPIRKLHNATIAFPESANRQLAVELKISQREVHVAQYHWYTFDPQMSSLKWENVEGVEGMTVRQLTPYDGMSHERYQAWFSQHRRRRRGLPIYRDYRHQWQNKILDWYVKLRHEGIKLLVRGGLK